MTLKSVYFFVQMKFIVFVVMIVGLVQASDPICIAECITNYYQAVSACNQDPTCIDYAQANMGICVANCGSGKNKMAMVKCAQKFAYLHQWCPSFDCHDENFMDLQECIKTLEKTTNQSDKILTSVQINDDDVLTVPKNISTCSSICGQCGVGRCCCWTDCCNEGCCSTGDCLGPNTCECQCASNNGGPKKHYLTKFGTTLIVASYHDGRRAMCFDVQYKTLYTMIGSRFQDQSECINLGCNTVQDDCNCGHSFKLKALSLNPNSTFCIESVDDLLLTAFVLTSRSIFAL